jgi:hypothetical protein
MYKNLTTNEIAEYIVQDKNSTFSYNGAFALAEYLEELEENQGEETEIDIVQIRCNYSEYESLTQWAQEYYDDWTKDMGVEFDGEESEDEIDDLIRNHILDNGHLIEFFNGVIVSSF